MTEAKFTRSLKEAIFKRLEFRLRKSGLVVGLDNIRDLPPQFARWRGRPDIWIAHDTDPHIMIVELEHHSGSEQAIENYRQAFEWCLRGQSRGTKGRVSFLHIIADDSDISPTVYNDLMSLETDRPRSGFLYRLVPYRPVAGDNRRSIDTAEAILKHRVFQDSFADLAAHAWG